MASCYSHPPTTLLPMPIVIVPAGTQVPTVLAAGSVTFGLMSRSIAAKDPCLRQPRHRAPSSARSRGPIRSWRSAYVYLLLPPQVPQLTVTVMPLSEHARKIDRLVRDVLTVETNSDEFPTRWQVRQR